MRSLLAVLGLVVSAAPLGCARRAVAKPLHAAPVPASAPAKGKPAAEIRAGFERSKKREPYLPMMSQEAAHAAMPNQFKGRPMPNLMLVAGLQPKTMEAVLNVAKQARTEGDLEPRLLNDVFWAVSSANDCFY